MMGSPRLWLRGGSGGWPARAVAAVFALVAMMAAVPAAQAQVVGPPVGLPPPIPTPTMVNADISTGATALNLGSTFLERLGNQASGFDRIWRNNPGGGGASEAADNPPLRSWAEAYGISARNGAQGPFAADNRQTWGGVAGLGARVAPGVNIGVSIDQSRTSIDVPLALQSASLDLTQLGFNASVDKGPWTWAIALVHGFGAARSSRESGPGFATAAYHAELDGALTELSYYWNIEQTRIVPKVGFEYVRAANGSFREAGGVDPLTVGGATLERARMLLGAEVGHYWIVDRRVVDLSAYGKFVDNFSQNFSTITASLGPESITLQGIGESRYGADAGASASIGLSNTARVYLNYDGKFRTTMQSHQGTVGVEVRW